MSDAGSEQRLYSDSLLLELGRELVARGRVEREQVEQLTSRAALTGDAFDQLLVRDGMVSEQEALELLSELTDIPFKPIADFRITSEIARKIPARVALRYRVLPVTASGATLTLATNSVPPLSTVDSLRMLLNCALDFVLCTTTDVDKALKHFYGLGADTLDALLGSVNVEEDVVQGRDVSGEGAEEGVVRFVNQIIAEAIQMDATDIHLEPFENSVRLRYRIDGILQEIPVPEGVIKLRKALPSAIKIMAEMNIAERRKPHDGRINVRLGSEEFDLRVSILPTPFGETVNMRILNRKSMFIDMEHLGLGAHQKPLIEQLSGLPHGVVLLTGPTGSGKTTTLYALLSRISTTDVKVITVEDPIEYQIGGINQIQVHAQIGLTFASILRSILRHDPDIVLIGEIRDGETADIAVRASLTGHLVFSTLHTNDAPSAVARLIDMGIEPYLVSSCLEGVIAQRLVRRVCASCKQPFTPTDTVLDEIAGMYPDRMADAEFLQGNGCPACNFTGYKGRIALFEIMALNDAIRSQVVHERPANEIKREAIKNGLITLRRDGWNRVLLGQTTPAEVMRVARKE